MNKLKRALLAVSLSAAPAFTLTAQQTEEPPGEARLLVREPSPLFIALDLDRDGVISTEEIARAPESLAALDRNKDGRVTPDEIFHPRLREGDEDGAGRRMALLPEGSNEGVGPRIRLRGAKDEGPKVLKILDPLFTVLDVDGDAVLSADEIAGAWKTLLDLDANGDGALTMDEVRPILPKTTPASQ